MKIYQIIKAVGCYDDYHEYVQATYLHKEKAEQELAQLKTTVPDCDDCPYSEEGQESPLETNCPFHKPKYINYNDGWAPYYECENCIDPYDAPSYRMKEYEVDESENSELGEWERLGENATVCSKCGKGLQDSHGYGFVLNEFAYCPFCGRAMKVRKP